MSVNAQQYYFKRYQVENGLSNNTVFCSAQDKAGFMWFGTKDGLNRFDGYSFKVFRNKEEDPSSVGSSYIHSLLANDDGTLWVGTRKGLYKYDPVQESFKLFAASEGKDTRDIKRDKQGNLWIIFAMQLYKFDVAASKLVPFANFTNATGICVTTDGSVWIATTNGNIATYNKGTNSFSFYNVFDHSKPVGSKWIEKIYEAGPNTLLIGTSNQGMKSFDRSTLVYKDVLTYNEDKTETYVRDIVQYNPHEYWIATEAGIYIYNTQTEKFTHLQKDYSDPYSISDNAIYTLCKDNEGGVWAGTYFGGVSFYPRQYAYFEKYFPSREVHGLWGNAVREICEDKYGNLWIGTEDAGLNKLDRTTGLFYHFQPSGEKGSIAYSNIHGLLAVDDELWIGTFERGLDIMNIRTGKVIKHYAASGQPNAFRSNFIITMHRTRSGKIFIGTGIGLYEYDPVSDGFVSISSIAPNDFIYALYEGADGTLWVGTENHGLFSYNPVTKESKPFPENAANKNSIGNYKINGIFEDKQQCLWVATEGGGLCMFNKKQNTFKRYNAQNGLPSDFVFSILQDDKNNLWATTSRGLVCLDPGNDRIKVYSKEDGLLSDQFNYNSGYEDTQGNLYFGSVKGLIRFNPHQFTGNTFVPPLFITGFQVYNKELSLSTKDPAIKKSVLFADKISLKHDQSSFSIDFAALSFTSPERTEYAYIMEGLDKKWTYLSANRKAYFTELSPGSYTFRVKASTNGSSFDNEIKLVIEIMPPFWQSGAAYVLYFTLACIVLYLLIRNYHHRHEEKNRRKIELMEHEKEKEIYNAKIEFFTNVTHEIRTPLTLIKGPVEDMMEESADIPKIQSSLKIVEKNTNRLIDLTNQLLDFRQTESSGFSLDFTTTDITALLVETYQQFKPMATQRKLQYTIDLPTAPLIAPADVEACRKILSNLFSNAIKYGVEKVEVILHQWQHGDRSFVIEIRNDGFLIPHDMREKIFEPFYRIKETQKQKGTGIGLSIARSLAELHKGSLVLGEPVNGLNTFILSLPFTQEKQSSFTKNEEKSI